MNDETILESVKAKLPLVDMDDSFDSNILDYIRMAVSTLNQLGTTKSVFVDKNTTYSELYLDNSSNETKMLIQSYIRQQVEVLFDTPATGAANANNMAALAQLEWRVQISVTNIDDPNTKKTADSDSDTIGR